MRKKAISININDFLYGKFFSYPDSSIQKIIDEATVENASKFN